MCPRCNRGPFVDLLQHAALYGGRVHDEGHLELALRLVREERAAKSAMMAQFTKEVPDDSETVTRQEMAEALGKEAERTEKAMAELATGLLKLLGWSRRPRWAGPRPFVKSCFGDPDRIRTGDLRLDRPVC